MTIIIKWEVEDGYAGKSRPQETVLDTCDYYEDNEYEKLTEAEKNELIHEAVQEDFNNKISYGITRVEMEDY